MAVLLKKSSLVFLLPVFLFLIHLSFVNPNTPAKHSVNHVDTALMETGTDNMDAKLALYDQMGLSELELSQDAFDYAIKGYEYLRSIGKLSNDQIVTIVDFSLSSAKKRLFVIDVKNGKLLYHTYVAHGRNSGKEIASSFSNSPESFKSSLGFYVTKNTYSGAHGYSLRLEGEEKGINDNAISRAIVMHSADYVNKNLINSQGYIGRSLGCPALPKELYKPIIEKIKNGSCLFMYSPVSDYASTSKLLQLASVTTYPSANDSIL